MVIVNKVCLLAVLASVQICANAIPVKFAAETPAMANAKMTEIERNGSSYLGRHVIGFAGDSIELEKGIHHISLDGPHDYIFDFSISIGDKNVTVGEVSIYPKNCKPELKAVWAGPSITVNKKGAVTLTLATPQFGLPTGHGACASPLIVPCGRQRVALDIQTSPHGAEIWIDGNKQPMRTNQLFERELAVCNNKVDVLLRLPGKTNCNRKVSLLGTSTPKVSCSFAGAIAR